MQNQISSGGRRWVIIAVAALLLGSGAMIALMAPQWNQQEPRLPEAVTLQLDWVHGGDFAGYYAAEEMGFYGAENLNTSFLAGGSGIDPTATVINGEAQFGTASAHHLLRTRAAGHPVQAIACIYQRSPFVFAALESSGIRHPRDFVGKTIRMPKQALPTLGAVMENAKVEGSEVSTVETRDTARFTSGEIEVWGGYITGAVRRIKSAGHALSIIFPDDFGVHDYHECLFTTDRLIADHPQLVARFLKASLEGWLHAVDNVEEVAAMVAAYDESGDLQDATDYVRTSRPLFNLGDKPVGWMTAEIWHGIADNLRAAGQLDQPVDASNVYSHQFLQGIYPDGEGGTNEQ